MGDDFQPREHDHLVEPVFGGLGARRGREGDTVEATVTDRIEVKDGRYKASRTIRLRTVGEGSQPGEQAAADDGAWESDEERDGRNRRRWKRERRDEKKRRWLAIWDALTGWW